MKRVKLHIIFASLFVLGITFTSCQKEVIEPNSPVNVENQYKDGELESAKGDDGGGINNSGSEEEHGGGASVAGN